jgi:predicted tellurium resistance membrane protein TerC
LPRRTFSFARGRGGKADYWAKLFLSVPATFTFGLKVPEMVTCKRWPKHARYGVHERLEGESAAERTARGAVTMGGVLVQIALLDIVFSLDSVITAVGMAEQVAVMIAAIMLAVGFMTFAAGPVSAFVERHPTVKMLALSFLLLIGVTLRARASGSPEEASCAPGSSLSTKPRTLRRHVDTIWYRRTG